MKVVQRKSKSQVMKKIVLTVSCLILSLLSKNSRATVLYWDPEGTTTQTTANLAGTWSTTASQWSTSSAQSAPTTWVSTDAACFCAQTGTAATGTFEVTLTSTISCAGLFNGSLTPAGYNVILTNGGGGSLNFISGNDALDTSGSDGDPTLIYVPITGPGTATCEGGNQLYLEVPNTYTGGTLLGYINNALGNIVNFTNNSFGTGSVLFSNASGAALVALGTKALIIPNGFTNVQTNVSSMTFNIVGTVPGVTFSGPWDFTGTGIVSGFPTSQMNLSSGGAANDLNIISGTITGTNGFNKYGVGMLELSGANTYGKANTALGNTYISNGWFIVANTTGSATGVSSVVVTNSASPVGTGTLTGSGTISGSVTNFGNMSATNMAGGCATLTTGNETWNKNSVYICAIKSASLADKISVNGNVTINSGVTIDVISLTSGNLAGSLASTIGANGASWPILTASGTITGFANLSLNTSGVGNQGTGSFTLTQSGSTIYLNFGTAPVVTINPSGFGADLGSSNNIDVTVTSGSGTPTYAWQLNGGALTADASGQGTANLTINPTLNQDAGSYTVTVSNPIGNTTASSLLAVVNPPVFSGTPGAGTMMLNLYGPAGKSYRVWSTNALPPPNAPVTVVDNWNLVGPGQFNSQAGQETTFTDSNADSTTNEFYTITIP
jgi:hypothetical protein